MRRLPLAAVLGSVVLVSIAQAQPTDEAPAPAETPLAAPAPPAVTPSVARAGFRYQLFGFLRLKGGVIADDPNVAFVGRNDGFTLQNARIGLAGGYGDRLAFSLSADGAVDERVGANATTGTLRFALKDAYLDLRLIAALTVRAVRFEPIFDLEEIIPYTERAFVDRALDVLTDGVSGSNPLNQEAVKQLASFAARNLVGLISDAAAKVPIPAVEGMTIVDAQVTTGEANGGYLVVSGNVAVR